MYSRHSVSGLRVDEVVLTPAQWRPDAAEHTAELLPERGVAERVEERVERGVEIADPRDRSADPPIHVTVIIRWVLTQSAHSATTVKQMKYGKKQTVNDR